MIRCDFCGVERGALWHFPVPVAITMHDLRLRTEWWGACEHCVHLVLARDVNALSERVSRVARVDLESIREIYLTLFPKIKSFDARYSTMRVIGEV